MILLLIIVTMVISKNSKNSLRKNRAKKAHKARNSLKVRKALHKKQISYVGDRSGFGSEMGVVVRKSPTVHTGNQLGYPILPLPYRSTWFQNSNTSNGPNLGHLGKSPEIVNNSITFHDRQPITMVKETPAHLGYRHEKQVINSVNKQTGKVESHTLHNKVPLYGNIMSTHTAVEDSVKQYDLDFRRMRKSHSQVHENPEFRFDAADNKYTDFIN